MTKISIVEACKIIGVAVTLAGLIASGLKHRESVLWHNEIMLELRRIGSRPKFELLGSIPKEDTNRFFFSDRQIG
jgi:hypothetical protein